MRGCFETELSEVKRFDGFQRVLVCAVLVLVAACNATASGTGESREEERDREEEPDGGEPAARFTVGGSMSGLSSEVVLGLSDEELLVDQNGRFVFEQELADGVRYEVVVVDQPADEFCVVENGEGRVDGEDVEEVEVICEAGNPGLSDVRFSVGSLEPGFDGELGRYRVDVPAWVEHVDVEPVLADDDVVVEVTGERFEGEPLRVELDEGQNTVLLEVQTESGEQREYTVDIFRAGSIVEEAYGKTRSATEGAQVGATVDVARDWVAAGAPGDSSASTGVNGSEDSQGASLSGAVFVFRRDGAEWEQQAYLKAENAEADDLFGFSVALSVSPGDEEEDEPRVVLVVGAPEEAGGSSGVNGRNNNNLPGSGAAYVFELVEGRWEQTAYLKAEMPATVDSFGRSVAIDGDRIVVGAYHESSDRRGVNAASRNEEATNAGAAHVFERRGGGWTQVAYLKASNTDAGDQFGDSVAIDGDTIVVGATGEQGDVGRVNGDQSKNELFMAGAAYVFEYDEAEDSWFQSAYLKPRDVKERFRFGNSVSVSGETIAVGAFTEPSSGTGVDPDGDDVDSEEAGAVYVFRRDGEEWKQEAFLKASNTDERDHFGHRVALHGDTLVVSANLESSADRGIEPPQSNDEAPGTGAVYLFFRDRDGAWSQKAYLKASNAEAGDNFGHGVGFDGVNLVVGAPFEDSAIGGVTTRGSPNNANAGAGAVYWFR